MTENIMMQHHRRGEDNTFEEKRKKLTFILRQWLNIAFMIIALVGVGIYLWGDRTTGIFVVLVSMAIKMSESALRMLTILTIAAFFPCMAFAQSFSGYDENGKLTNMDAETGQKNFNPHNRDTTKVRKEVPKGIYVWTVDRKLGDILKTEVDTIPHLYPQTTLAPGVHGEYNTLGSNYTPRLSRIYVDRKENDQFIFTQFYDQVMKRPDELHFTNTLSPITNLSYDNCGNKTDGEDHLEAKFAVNAGKRIGLGFDLNYAYARGYYQNQSISHFGATLYGSYIGDRYQLHAMFSNYHQKVSENGGISNDDYITHPELFTESYTSTEIPTVLSSNWNRNDSRHFFLTHRYSVGFYRDVPMTEKEIEAKKFAMAAQREKEIREAKEQEEAENGGNSSVNHSSGRPQNSKIAGRAPAKSKNQAVASDSTLLSITDSTIVSNVDSTLLANTDTTRIKVTSKAMADSLLALEAAKDSTAMFMKKEYVPVTSFIHTLDVSDYERLYQSYNTPKQYYANRYFQRRSDYGYPGDSIRDEYNHLMIKNTLGLALLEGFNKWAQAGVKVFGTHELRRFEMPTLNAEGLSSMERWTEHNISVGGRLSKTQGHTLHYLLGAETWLIGEDAGQLKLDFQTDINFPLFGDTVRLAAKAFFHRTNPTFFERHYHGKHFWWDNNYEMTTRTRAEGSFSIDRTKTKLRVAIEEMQNYTYFGVSYDRTANGVTNVNGGIRQHTGNIQVLTAQLQQDFKLGPLHWDNIVTFQSSSNKEVLPLPVLNAFTNLYLSFTYAKVLRVELGGSATYFTNYYGPDYIPQLGQFAVQENSSRQNIGNFPFVDVYANLHLKHARFFVMINNVTASSFNRHYFLTPHYAMNASVMHMGVSWNFFN